MTTAAIFHHPDAVESEKMPLAGRRTAGQSFLTGLARHARGETLYCVADKPDHLKHFEDLIGGFGWRGGVEGILSHDAAKLSGPGAIFVPGPSLASYAWKRRRVGQGTYSICGITHTVSTRRIMEGLFDTLTAPVEDWDAIICTSQAVRQVLATQLGETAAYFGRRFGAKRVPGPQLPVIPLGVDTERFAADPAERAEWRARFGLGDDDIAILTMGRLSVYEKMNPAPLMIALQRAAEQTGRQLVLLMAGWFDSETSEKVHRACAQELAPSVRVEFPDGKDPALRYAIWSAADIFALPVDNIQETFGLAPIEAMAAGLPVVCSDWDGFKDTIEHGVTGFRVRTLMSRPGFGEGLGHRFEDGIDTYFQYLTFLHQRTAIDLREMADALVLLIGDPERRREMGEAGRRRARQLYDWSAVIPQYEDLWSELSARRARGMPSSAREAGTPANPTAMDPFRLYAGYPSDILPETALLRAARDVPQEEIERLIVLSGASNARRMVVDGQTLMRIMAIVRARGPVRVGDAVAETGMTLQLVEGALLWLHKFDLVQIEI